MDITLQPGDRVECWVSGPSSCGRYLISNVKLAKGTFHGWEAQGVDRGPHIYYPNGASWARVQVDGSSDVYRVRPEKVFRLGVLDRLAEI